MPQEPPNNETQRYYPTRASTSAYEARRASLDRIRGLTARQRVELALALGRRSQVLCGAKLHKAEQAE